MREPISNDSQSKSPSVVARRPNGIPQAEDFGIRSTDIPKIAEGQFLIRNEFLSADPAMRGWIADKSNYWPRIEVGDTMRAFSAGTVMESMCTVDYRIGDKGNGDFRLAGLRRRQPSRRFMRKVPRPTSPYRCHLVYLA